MIRLTLVNGEAWNVNPDYIIDIMDGKDGAAVTTGNFYSRGVKESREEVARKMLEWKLEMERYKAAAIVALTHRANENNPYMPPLDAQRELEILAGLEEPNHDER